MADERDPKVSQRYSELPGEEPSRELDQTILAAAHRATDKPHAPLVVPAGRHRWYFSLAAAAVLVLAIAVTMQVERQQPDPERAVATPPAPAVREEPSKAAAAPAPARQTYAPDPPRQARAAPAPAPAPRPEGQPRADEARRAEEKLAMARREAASEQASAE